MRLFLYVLRESGVKGVPSFDGFRKMQAELRAQSGVPTIPCKSALGNVFWMVDPRTLLAQDWSNPLIRPHIHVYPEIPNGPISEVWHTKKWHSGLDTSMLSPMYDAKDRHFYIQEVARTTSGELVVPARWIVYHGALHADIHRVVKDNETGLSSLTLGATEMIPASSLAANYFDLEAEGALPHWVGMLTLCWSPLCAMPNPLREVAGGEPLYSSFINHFVDDVSGNHSKSWNKHINTYMTHANLPRKFLQQEAHIHFVSTSPHATTAEQFADFKKVLISTHSKPVRVVDPLSGQAARFRVFVHAEQSDNPMQSEVSGHIGGNGNFFCRKCEVGGTTAHKATNDGFHALFEPGDPRTKAKTLEALQDQVQTACLGVEKHVRKKQTDTGVKDPYTEHAITDLLKRARTQKADHPERTSKEIQRDLLEWVDKHVDAVYNPFLTMPGLDPTQDTPVEILHTVLLGVIKYAWHWTHTSWSPAQKTTYMQRLQATSTNGLSIHAIRASYIIQYANSLIGRQLKTVAQTTAFHVHDMLPPEKFQLWLAIGEMTSLIWFPEIQDQETYKNDLTTAIANVLDVFAEIDPSKIVDKVKLHILTHGIEDISRFGPLIDMCTEGFESFNGVFRNCSIHSNHLAPSRDIAQQLADQEAHKHRLLGGIWCTAGGNWVRAGVRVCDFLHQHQPLRRLIGWSVVQPSVPGSFQLAAIPVGKKSRPTVSLGMTRACAALNANKYDMDLAWTVCRSVESRAQDQCRRGSWICAQSPLNVGPPCCPLSHVLGRIDGVFALPEHNKAVAVIEMFEVAASRHTIMQMPWLVRRQGEPSFVIVEGLDILFSFNVQHDCAFAGCAATEERAIQQERTESNVCEKFITHKDVARFIINTHTLHNPHLIRSVLPRDLVAPVPRFEDRRMQHDKLAASLRTWQQQKQAVASAWKAAKGATLAEMTGSAAQIARPTSVPAQSTVGGSMAGTGDSGPPESAMLVDLEHHANVLAPSAAPQLAAHKRRRLDTDETRT
ncbi:hypothetical protein BD413DRAFT_683781 [Trametes elegans]|nr:hypothetical protein BD413DRAFT_683781 [Trametes elegans]